MIDSVERDLLGQHRDPMLGNWISLCIAIHLVVDFLCIRGVLQIESSSAFAIAAGQLSLIALWAGTSRVWFILRYVVMVAAVIACWCLCSYLAGFGIHGPVAASWAITFSVQAVTIYVVISVYRACMSAIARGQTARSALRFDLFTVLVWTTGLAIAFGIYQLGRSQFRWVDIFDAWEFSYLVPFLGCVHGVIAAVCMWPYAGGPTRTMDRWSLLKRFGWSVGVLAAVVISICVALRYYTGHIEGRELWWLLIPQIATVAFSLAMVIRFKRIGGRFASDQMDQSQERI